MRRLSQHRISPITNSLNKGNKEQERAQILGFYKSPVAGYRGRTLNHISMAVRGRLRKLKLRDKRALTH